MITRNKVFVLLFIAVVATGSIGSLLVVLHIRETEEQVMRDRNDLEKGAVIFPVAHFVVNGEPGPIYKDRLDTASLLWRGRPRPIWLLAGGQTIFRESGAKVGQRYLIGKGVPASAIKILDDFPQFQTSLDTTQEIGIASAIAKKSAASKIIVVAEVIHLAQARLVFSHYGVDVLLVDTPQRQYGARYVITRYGALLLTLIDRRGHSLFWLRWFRKKWPNWPWMTR